MFRSVISVVLLISSSMAFAASELDQSCENNADDEPNWMCYQHKTERTDAILKSVLPAVAFKSFVKARADACKPRVDAYKSGGGNGGGVALARCEAHISGAFLTALKDLDSN